MCDRIGGDFGKEEIPSGQLAQRQGCARMQDTLQSLVERALAGQPGFLEFYLRDQSRLPGPRANIELAQDFSDLLTVRASGRPDETRALLNHLMSDEKKVVSNTPGEFVLFCGVLSFGACACAIPEWRENAYTLLAHYAQSSAWRVREATALAWQKMLIAVPDEALPALMNLLDSGDCLQLRACLAAISEPALLNAREFIEAALVMQRVAVEYLHSLPSTERRRTEVRTLRQALGYTLSVVTAACPDDGFALMCEIATWNDPDINWILRENLKKRRLAKFREYTDKVISLMA